MQLRPRLAALAVAAFLVAPSAALAQSAGDQQYSDPFAGQGGGGGSSQSSGSQGSQGSGSQSSSGQSSSGQSSGGGSSEVGQSSAATASDAAAQGASSRQLPRTGGEPGLVALLGAGLVAGGAGLRLRVRRSAD